jgi:hypothetical protein
MPPRQHSQALQLLSFPEMSLGSLQFRDVHERYRAAGNLATRVANGRRAVQNSALPPVESPDYQLLPNNRFSLGQSAG